MKAGIGIVGVLFALAGVPAGAATSMRCGVALVSEGLHAFEVVERCGEPAYQHAHVEYRGYDIGPFWVVPVQVEEWVYDLGQVKFRRLLRFEDGRLRRIETLGRGVGTN